MLMSIFDYDPKRSILDPDLFNEDISDAPGYRNGAAMSKDADIKPRTKSERLAYVAGYADALANAANGGFPSARIWLKQMLEHELEVDRV